ncbi:MAG: hypothetical protein HYX26_09030 [Acidobacteriales bacterium]|nr:hypothetical protein [Terriglobales bacterium]
MLSRDRVPDEDDNVAFQFDTLRDRTLALGPGGIARTRDDLINDGRQFFVKVNYLFRF